jgi:hypothetical protein
MRSLEITSRSLAKADSKELKPVTGGWAILKLEMVSQLPKLAVFNIVLASVARAYIDLNLKATSDEDRAYLVNELTNNIIKYHPAIRLNEIPDAIALGIRGRFGEFYGLSVIAFERFIEQYLLSDKRTRMVKELPVVDPTKPVPSLQTQFEMAKQLAMLAFERKKEGKDISGTSTTVYNFLDKLNLLQFTISEKKDMMADATRELIAELKYKLMISPPTERAAIKKDIEAYTAVITEHKAVNDRQFTLAKMRAKKLALDAFLNNVILENEDLSLLIDEKQEVFLAG